MESMDEVRARLEPEIRAQGIRETARATGVASSSIHQWLDGRASLSFARIQAIATLVGYRLTMNYKLEPIDENTE